MKKDKKRYILFSFLLLLLIVIVVFSSFILYQNRRRLLPQLFPLKRGNIQVFGKPNARDEATFTANKSQFTAQITSLKSPSLDQQSVIVYNSSDKKKMPIFERQYYADGFRGKILTYSPASDSATITQSGSLGTIGCSENNCTMLWSNFYIWNPQQRMFILDNSAHKDFFQQLLTSYQTMDKVGCSLIGNNTVANQIGMSFTQLYKETPTLSWYCSETQGIVPTNLVFFLKAEKTIEEILSGNNIGSTDINDVSL